MKFFLLALPLLCCISCTSRPTAEEELTRIVHTCETQLGLSWTAIDSMSGRVTVIEDSLAKSAPTEATRLGPLLDEARIWLMQCRILTVHDRTMPRMGDLVETKAYLGAIKSLPKQAADSVAAARLALQRADDAMMAWMRTFRHDVPKQKISYETAMAYLKAQQDSIAEVEKRMDESMQQGQALLAKYKKQ